MKLLALETSTERLSLAVQNGEHMFLRDIDAGQRHSELALAALRELLAESGLTIAELDAIAFGQGPGSFVGVRIACGLAQGLALGAGKSLLPVPTLMALAGQAKEQAGRDAVLVAVDARMGEYYFAAYRRDQAAANGWRAEVEPMLATRDGLPPISGDDWQAIGSAFHVDALATVLQQRYQGQYVAPAAPAFPSAADIARIAARTIAHSGAAVLIPPQQAAPLYLRNHVALTIAEREQNAAAKLAAVPA